MAERSPIKSMTIVGGAGAIIAQTAIGLGLFPADANDPINAIITSGMEIARNIFILVGIYGARRAKGDLTKLIAK